jgi:hypothetical protein
MGALASFFAGSVKKTGNNRQKPVDYSLRVFSFDKSNERHFLRGFFCFINPLLGFGES